VDVKPLISHCLPHTEFARAFALAADRTQSMKVQLSFA
jgi:L-idonate 5-dehydrogenase